MVPNMYRSPTKNHSFRVAFIIFSTIGTLLLIHVCAKTCIDILFSSSVSCWHHKLSSSTIGHGYLHYVDNLYCDNLTEFHDNISSNFNTQTSCTIHIHIILKLTLSLSPSFSIDINIDYYHLLSLLSSWLDYHHCIAIITGNTSKLS